MNELISTKNRVFISLVGPSETRKSQHVYNWLKIQTIHPKKIKNSQFRQHYQPLNEIMQKPIRYLGFVQGVDLEIKDSFKKTAKYLLTFEDPCEKICNSNAFVDVANAGRHRGLSTFYIKHILFPRSKLGWDVELQNTDNVPINSSMIWCKFKRWVDNYNLDQRWSTGIENQHLFLTVFCNWLVATNTRLIILLYKHRIQSLKIFYPGPAVTVKGFEQANSLYFSSVPIISPEMQMSFPPVVPKRVYQAPLRL